jgi:hypothetical protein
MEWSGCGWLVMSNFLLIDFKALKKMIRGDEAVKEFGKEASVGVMNGSLAEIDDAQPQKSQSPEHCEDVWTDREGWNELHCH